MILPIIGAVLGVAALRAWGRRRRRAKRAMAKRIVVRGSMRGMESYNVGPEPWKNHDDAQYAEQKRRYWASIERQRRLNEWRFK